MEELHYYEVDQNTDLTNTHDKMHNWSFLLMSHDGSVEIITLADFLVLTINEKECEFVSYLIGFSILYKNILTIFSFIKK